MKGTREDIANHGGTWPYPPISATLVTPTSAATYTSPATASPLYHWWEEMAAEIKGNT